MIQKQCIWRAFKAKGCQARDQLRQYTVSEWSIREDESNRYGGSSQHASLQQRTFVALERGGQIRHLHPQSGTIEWETENPIWSLLPDKTKCVKHSSLWFCHFHPLPRQDRKKVDDKSLVGMLVGFDEEQKGYRVYVPSKRKVIVTAHVRIDEHNVQLQNGESSCLLIHALTSWSVHASRPGNIHWLLSHSTTH